MSDIFEISLTIIIFSVISMISIGDKDTGTIKKIIPF